MSDRVSKELSASAKSLSESRECFIEVYIDKQCLIIIVYYLNNIFKTFSRRRNFLSSATKHRRRQRRRGERRLKSAPRLLAKWQLAERHPA
jgi:hypothetical protein